MDAAAYRAKASEMRERASATADAGVRGHMLAMAEQFEWLADDADKHERDSKKP